MTNMTTPTLMGPPHVPLGSKTKTSQMIEAESILADIDIGITDLATVADNIMMLLGPSNTTVKRQVRSMSQALSTLHGKMEDAMRKLCKLRAHQDLIKSKKAAITNRIVLEQAAASSNKRKSPPLHSVRIQELCQSSKQSITPSRSQPKRSKTSRSKFSSSTDSDEPYYGDLDGCYLHLDTKRMEHRRAGQTTAGFENRNKQHLKCSKLQTVEDRMKPFYATYPHSSVDPKPSDHDGLWEDLEQVVGIGMEYGKRDNIVGLFDWSDSDIKHLGRLKKGAHGDEDLVSKQYRHLCYMFETFFAVAIARTRNLSSSPGCEWQTGYICSK